MNGILIIDKPTDFTSHDVVAKVRRILRTKRVGHTGTLDPFATGVMVILIGQATRLAQFLDKDVKEYEATIRFGFETDTGDLTGTPKQSENSNFKVEISEVEAALKDFRGAIEQTPPMYSAKKIEGKKLYELARKGIEIERQPVKVNIHQLEIIQDPSTDTVNQIQIRVACSAGTYIRTLAEDIGRKIGIGAHLTALRRTQAGKFDLSRSVTLEQLENIVAENSLDETLISMNEAVSHLPERKLSAEEIAKVKNGVKIKPDGENYENAQAIRLIDEDNNLVAIGFYQESENFIQPKTVLL